MGAVVGATLVAGIMLAAAGRFARRHDSGLPVRRASWSDIVAAGGYAVSTFRQYLKN